MIAPQDPFHAFIMAKDRVEQRLHLATQALDRAGIPYAVVGGNAVSYWVAQTNPAGTRSTKDVDLLVDRQHLDRITSALGALGFRRLDIRDFVLFLDPDEPDKRAGVHLVWAGERLRPSYSVLSPAVSEAARTPGGFAVVSLAALVRMKLTSNRPIDQVHVADLLSVGCIDEAIRATLPSELLGRLRAIELSQDE